jgi:hypothetical protein
MKRTGRPLGREGELNFAYIAMGVMVVFVVLAAIKYTGERSGAVQLPKIEAR